jgi:aminoglycoside phosphotransferase (APT) family kinase protein
MLANDVDTDVPLVRRLLTAQFPQWGDLSIEPVPSDGTDNALYRLGDELVVRLPRIPSAVADPTGTATDLARFVAALQRVDPTGGPSPGEHNSLRGVSLTTRDRGTRAVIATLDDTFDTDALTAAWDAAVQTPPWHGPGVWLRGDLQAGNLLAMDGRLSAVIDFGCLGVGDPACDVTAAWLYLPTEARATFRDELEVDDATWARGRGWALSLGLGAVTYYERSNPVLAGIARRAIHAVLADHASAA